MPKVPILMPQLGDSIAEAPCCACWRPRATP